jgi:hypothetical protein
MPSNKPLNEMLFTSATSQHPSSTLLLGLGTWALNLVSSEESACQAESIEYPADHTKATDPLPEMGLNAVLAAKTKGCASKPTKCETGPADLNVR